MINKLKYAFLPCALNPSVNKPKLINSRLQKKGLCSSLHSTGSVSWGAQLCSGGLGKMLCNCAIPCQDSLAFPCSFQAKFLQVHDQFWASKQSQIKRKRQSKQFISSGEAKISLQWDVLLMFYLLWLPHLRRELRKPGCEIQREGSISTHSLSLLLLHMRAVPPHQFALSFTLTLPS